MIINHSTFLNYWAVPRAAADEKTDRKNKAILGKDQRAELGRPRHNQAPESMPVPRLHRLRHYYLRLPLRQTLFLRRP